MMMKYLTIDFLISFLLVSFSSIKSIEILNEWEDSTQILNLASEDTPLSLALNNSIQSPLFKINNIYYFCSSSSLFKIEQNKIEEIKINITIGQGTINSLKCYYYPNMGSIIVGLIGTYEIVFYNIKDKNWKKTHYGIPNNLIDMNSYIDNENILYFAAVSREYNEYYLSVLKGKDDSSLKSNTKKIKGLQFQENQKIVIGFRDEKTIIIFTYIQGQSFNLYHYNYEESSMKLVGKNYISYFNGYSFIKANFIENTPIIYYLITRNGRYYLGAADLKYFIVLYNIEVFNNVEIIYGGENFGQSYGFLIYNENNLQKKVCPFALKGNLCEYNVKGKYLAIKKLVDDYYYLNYISDSCSNGLKFGNYCLEKCPINSMLSSEGTCIQCSEDYYYNYEKKLCSSKCKYNYVSKICYDCEKNINENKFFYEDTCITYGNCSEIYNIFNENTKTCEKCDNYYDLATNKCIDECPKYNEKMRINGINICIDCSFFNKSSLISNDLYFCYKKCPPYHISNIIDNITVCEKCPDNKKYQNGKCVDQCDSQSLEATSKINGTEIKYCKSCKETNKKLRNGICVDNCEQFSEKEENGICVQKCSTGYAIINDGKNEASKNNICQRCKDLSLFYENETCVNKCSSNMGWDESDNICEDCNKTGKYLEDNRCVQRCKETKRINSDENICKNCPEESPYFLGGQCVEIEQCHNYIIYHNKLCTYCSDDTFFYNNKCHKEKCPEPYISEKVDKKQICRECEEGKYYIKGECYSSCEEGSFSIPNDKSCHSCYCNDNGKCYNKTSNKCTCANREREKYNINYIDKYFGHSCEFSRTFKDDEDEDERYLKIEPFYYTSINSNVSLFRFSLTKPDPNKEYKYKEIKWKFYRQKEELTAKSRYKKFFLTGTSEEIFGINPNIYDLEKPNYIHLTLITDSETFDDEIKVYIQDLNTIIESNYNADFSDPKFQETGNLYMPMNTTVEINQIKYSNEKQYKFYYQFSFLDENNEEFQLSDYIVNTSLLTYYIPFAQQYVVKMKNDRGEIKNYSISKDNSDLYNNYENNEFKSMSISEILELKKYNNIEKLFVLMVKFNSNKKILTKNEFENVFNFINGIYKEYINNNGTSIKSEESNKYLINYFEPKLIFSLINYIIINQKADKNITYIQTILDNLEQYLSLLIKKDGENQSIKISSSDIKSFLRTIEQLLIAYNENYAKGDNDNSDILNKFYILFDKINNYLSSRLYPGEGIKIIGNRTVLLSYRLGFYQKVISISSNHLTSPGYLSNISTYTYEDYGLNEKEENCEKNGERFLCMKRDIYSNITNILLNEKGCNDIKDISFNIYIVNNLQKEEQNSNSNDNDNDNYLIHFQFYNIKNKENIRNIMINDSLFYTLEFYYKNEKLKTGVKSFIQEFYEKENKNDLFYIPYNYSKIFCYPKNYKKSEKYYCFTRFNYSSNVIQCKCNIIDDISIIENEELANYYKSLQFKSVNYTYTNKVTKWFVITFLFLLLIPGLLFLLFDIYKVNKAIRKEYGVDFKETRREYYHEVKSYTDTKFTFAIYSTFNKFPYCSAFTASHYTSPKYIKHLLVITAILLGFVLNLIPFFFTLPFEERQILMDKRDIEVDEEEIHSIRLNRRSVYRGLAFSVINLIFVHLFIVLFSKILKFEEKNASYWKNIKDIFKDFMYSEIKKKFEQNLKENLKQLKIRMKAFVAICGRYMLNKNIMTHPNRNKKLENYLKYNGKSGKINLFLVNNKIEINDDSKNKINNVSNESGPLLYELPENKNIINDSENDINIKKYNPPNLKININTNASIDKNSVISSSFGINNEIKLGDFLKTIKPKKTESFQFNLEAYKKFGITNNTICRFEYIKNKYVNSGRSFDSKRIQNRIVNNQEVESPLCVCYNNNISIIKIENYLEFNKNDSNQKGKEFALLIIVTMILGLIFFFLLFISIIIIKYLMNIYEYFMVKIWLLCTFLILFVLYFLFYFIKIGIASILLFNCYNKRKNGCLIKLLFRIFVDKNLIYMFKIRNYITKYRREFINI